MRPSRDAFEEMMSEYARHRAWRPSAKAALLGVYDAQEAQIRELADALEALLAYTLTSTSHSSGKLFEHVREVLKRTRGAEMEKGK